MNDKIENGINYFMVKCCVAPSMGVMVVLGECYWYNIGTIGNIGIIVVIGKITLLYYIIVYFIIINIITLETNITNIIVKTQLHVFILKYSIGNI